VDPTAAHELVEVALAERGAAAVAAMDGDTVVGLALAVPDPDAGDGGAWRLIQLGVSPAARRRGLARRLIGELVDVVGDGRWEFVVTVAERDPFEPLDRRLRAQITRRLLERAGFTVGPAPPPVGSIDPDAVLATR
jgi:GNAT superfamily N-acetyltransferase